MNQQNIPDRKQTEKTVLKSRRARQKLEQASIELESLIVRLEEANRLQRSKQLDNI